MSLQERLAGMGQITGDGLEQTALRQAKGEASASRGEACGRAVRRSHQAVLDKLPDAKAADLAKSHESSRPKFGEYLTAETREAMDQKLLSHPEAAKMLGGSVSTLVIVGAPFRSTERHRRRIEVRTSMLHSNTSR